MLILLVSSFWALDGLKRNELSYMQIKMKLGVYVQDVIKGY